MTTQHPAFQLGPGRVVDGYRIERGVAFGGGGAVFEAFDLARARRVALKVMHPFSRAHRDARLRFQREVELLARVAHPALVEVLGAGAVDGLPYLVLGWVRGETVKARLARVGPMPVLDAVAVAMQVGEGLAVLHALGLAHRDVSGQNVLVDGEGRATRATLVDFGIAKDVSLSGSRSSALGTPRYVAPEQLFGELAPDGRSDQYALGVVLYEMLTGDVPYRGDSILELALAVRDGGAQPPSTRRSEVPAALDAIILRAIAPEPGDRYPSTLAFADALDAAAGPA